MRNVTDVIVRDLRKAGVRFSPEDIDEVLSSIRCVCRPEDVFMEEDLQEWAFVNGYKN